jgi:hypothetical protein
LVLVVVEMVAGAYFKILILVAVVGVVVVQPFLT